MFKVLQVLWVFRVLLDTLGLQVILVLRENKAGEAQRVQKVRKALRDQKAQLALLGNQDQKEV